MKKRDPLYQAYLEAKARQWKEHRLNLTEKDFLDTVDPAGKHSPDQAANYIENLRTGKWSSKKVRQRSQQTGGRIYNILLADRSGKVVDSANVEIPDGRTLEEVLSNGKLERAVDKYLSSRHRMSAGDRKRYGIESVGHKSSKGLKIVGAQPLVTTRKVTEIVS